MLGKHAFYQFSVPALFTSTSLTASDTRRFRLNWFAITIANTLAGLGDFLTTSSLHQFVTSSTEPAENGVSWQQLHTCTEHKFKQDLNFETWQSDRNTRYCLESLLKQVNYWEKADIIAPLTSIQVRPGLGLSEIWYASIVGVLSLGQFVGAVLVGVLSRYIYTKYLMVCSLGLTAIGGIFYGIGSYGWMILIGQLLLCWYMYQHACYMYVWPKHLYRAIFDRILPGSSYDCLPYIHWRDKWSTGIQTTQGKTSKVYH